MRVRQLNKSAVRLKDKPGENMREALLEAGLNLFGEHGIYGTSTRMLASASGSNIGMISYYFESKEGLYLAVVEKIIENLLLATKGMREKITQFIRQQKNNPEDAAKILGQIMLGMVDLFLSNDKSRLWARVIVSEMLNPGPGFDLIYKNYITLMQQGVADLLSIIIGLPPASDEVKIRAHILVGHVVNFMLTREALLRNLGVSKFDKSQLGHINTILMEQVSMYLERLPE